MNTDIRLAVNFWQHPKVYRLEKKLGLKGIRSLQILWCWCAQNRPDGNLSDLAQDEIEFVADWRGKKGAFFGACIGEWIEETESGYVLHEWADYNPYQAQAGSREEARKEKARNAANARWSKQDANGCSSNATSNANGMLKQCSEQCSSNAQAMPTVTSTSTSTSTESKGNLNTPPLPPIGGSGECGSIPQIQSPPIPSRQEKPQSPRLPNMEPDLEFVQLRECWNRSVVPEGEQAGFIAYLAVKKARKWPGLVEIQRDIMERKTSGYWRQGYEPGLEKYLRELGWTAPKENPRAAAQSANIKSFTELQDEADARLREQRRRRAIEYDRRKAEEEGREYVCNE